MTFLRTGFALFLLIFLSACSPAMGPPSTKGPSVYPETIGQAFSAMRAMHVTPIDTQAFAAAGFAALNISGVDTGGSGFVVGQALADSYTRRAALQALGAEDVMQTFMDVGFTATLPDDVRFTAYFPPRWSMNSPAP